MSPLELPVKAWRALMTVASRDVDHPRRLNRVLLWPDRLVATDGHRLLSVAMPADPHRRGSFDAVAAWPFFERMGGDQICTAFLDEGPTGPLRFVFRRQNTTLLVASAPPDAFLARSAIDAIVDMPRAPAASMLLNPRYLDGLGAIYQAFGGDVLGPHGGCRILASEEGHASLFTFRNGVVLDDPTADLECVYVIMRLLEPGETRPAKH